MNIGSIFPVNSTYKVEICPLQEFHLPRYPMNFASQYETGSSEAVEAKKPALEQDIQETFGSHSSEPTKMEVVHCKNFIHRDIK